jgi:hypothetical protein
MPEVGIVSPNTLSKKPRQSHNRGAFCYEVKKLYTSNAFTRFT